MFDTIIIVHSTVLLQLHSASEIINSRCAADYYHLISHDTSSAALYLLSRHTVIHEFHTLTTNHNTAINSLQTNSK